MIHRLANEGDFETIYDMHMDEEANPYLTYDPMSKDAFRPLYQDLLKTRTLFVVESAGRVISTYRLVPKTGRQAHIQYLGGLVVGKQERGRGFGSEILSQIIRDARKQGTKRLELSVVKDNLKAIGMYLRLGFEIEGTMKMNNKLSGSSGYQDEYMMAVYL